MTPAEKALTRQATRRALDAGVLVRGPCEGCGGAETETHHLDYADPLAVVFLCVPCHLKAHGRERVVSDRPLAVLLRDRMGSLSQRAFAAKLGVSQTLISRLLNGKYPALGGPVARAIVAAFPDLRGLVVTVIEEQVAAAVGDAVLEAPAERPEVAG
jgi:hypothetical protein